MNKLESFSVDEENTALFFRVFLKASVLLAVCNLLFEKGLFPTTRFYDGEILVRDAASALFFHNTVLLLLGMAAVSLYLIYFCIKLPWKHVCDSNIRLFVLFVAFVVVWRNSTYGYNYLLDVSHHVDRLFLIAMFLLSIWRPCFLLFLFPVIWLLQGQFELEFTAYSIAQVSMPIKLLAAFYLVMVFTFFTKRRLDSVFLWLAVVVIMSHYWAAAYAKYFIRWHEYGEIHNMLAASYAGGWLGVLMDEEISSVLRIFANFDRFTVLFTLVFETAVIFALFNGFLLRMLLVLAVIFHVIIFAVSGIFFWQWIVINTAFLYFVLYKREKAQATKSRRSPNGQLRHPLLPKSFRTKITTAILIALSPHWMGAVELGWHDSPVSYVYQFRAFDSQDNSVVLTPAYFTPYEYPLTLNAVGFVSESNVLPITWGATLDLDLAKQLSAVSAEDEIFNIIEQQGSVRYDPIKAERFDNFVINFVSNKQADLNRKRWFDYFPAPLYLYTDSNTRQRSELSITRVEVHRIISWFDGENYQRLDDTLVRKIPIPEP